MVVVEQVEVEFEVVFMLLNSSFFLIIRVARRGDAWLGFAEIFFSSGN